MEQIPLFSQPHWSVSELTRYLRDLFESDDILQDLWVQGEISNLSRPGSGHMYFTLKDAGASLRCVMWRPSVMRLAFMPREGMAIEAHGSLSIYEVAGQYQLYADAIKPAGEGVLFQEFLRLKARLEAEGLFEIERKRPIPKFPERIGVVTSPTGAALRDILDTLRRRFPCVEVYLAPTPVQGIDAPPGIIAALNNLNRHIQPDIILVARGGGSIEDLWAFNDENVARAVVASSAPVITGVGHETDFTIADFVSDLRAPTPTAAAELATPNRLDLIADVLEQTNQLQRAFFTALADQRSAVSEYMKVLEQRSPVSRVATNRQRLDETTRRAEIALIHALQVSKAHLRGLEQNLASLNPQAVLRRGYAIIKGHDGVLVSMAKQVKRADRLTIRLQDGEFPAVVDGDPIIDL